LCSPFASSPRLTDCPPTPGGIFKVEMKFPDDYPNSPPSMRVRPGFFGGVSFGAAFLTPPQFLSKFWHPNVYDDGGVCISILHTPDPMSGERFVSPPLSPRLPSAADFRDTAMTSVGDQSKRSSQS
jgi:Ubiquitin-conjugating enzyme